MISVWCTASYSDNTLRDPNSQLAKHLILGLTAQELEDWQREESQLLFHDSVYEGQRFPVALFTKLAYNIPTESQLRQRMGLDNTITFNSIILEEKDYQEIERGWFSICDLDSENTSLVILRIPDNFEGDLAKEFIQRIRTAQ